MPSKQLRLSPAFDVVPNPAETPARLAMQLCLGRFDISRETVLGDALRFGFEGRAAAERYLDSGPIRFARGHALAPLPQEELRVKFMGCVAPHEHERASRLLEALERMGTGDDEGSVLAAVGRFAERRPRPI